MTLIETLEAPAMRYTGEAARPILPSPPAVFAVDPCADHVAVTDRGREIPLFHYEALAFPTSGRQVELNTDAQRREFIATAERRFLVNTWQDASQLVRLVESDPTANCHGWVFAEGRFGIEEIHVPSILEDQGYVAVQEPRAGDVVVFMRKEKLIHSGIVTEAGGGEKILIESKWGPFGVYRHGIESHPFHGICTFYRSPRNNRTLVIRRA
jgi:hypothetical protein